MTKDEKAQFDLMQKTLRRIAMQYQTTDELREDCQEDYGLEYEKALEMAYENIQAEAKNACMKMFKQRSIGT